MKIDALLYGPRRLTKPMGWAATAAYVVAGLLLVWSAFIHVHLWRSDGYRHISTIGPLFAFQSIVGMVMGVAVVAVRRVWIAVLGAGFALSTLAGFLRSVGVGLFGFQDTWSAPFAQQAFFIEIAATGALMVAGALCLTKPAQAGPTGSSQPGVPLLA
jgi:hypothetical protein